MVYEIISTFIGILALLISFGVLTIAVLTFLDKRNKKKKCPSCQHTGWAVSVRTF
ncbi:hypothetical protein H171_0276 [[Clostridium] celerecrescens 18A]|uniref:Uncharacterized protein n=1 Tax=[Clostridium] celerecrescens 18A TaxID=1286362 RepID=A0A2M8Z063_9FIRM|nr:hypothetical protein H171_0276 [[Clostridium] celerecrescens 18A]